MEVLQRTANRGSISTGYDIDNSLKFESDNSERISFTPSSAVASERRKHTISFWIKRTELGSTQYIYEWGGSEGDYLRNFVRFQSDDTLRFATSYNVIINTTRVFRDTSAWYHIVIQTDTVQSSNSDTKFWMYVNGELEASSTAFNVSDTMAFANNSQHDIGFTSVDNGAYGNYYLAEFHAVGGLKLAPTEFAETDEDSGIWKPKAYTGSYGTNGFYLDFESSGSLGADSSGNSNDFTLSNITAADQATDTPTNNFCTWNPLWAYPNTATVGNGGTSSTGGAPSVWRGSKGTIGLTNGKWYWEQKANGNDTIAGWQTENVVSVTGTNAHNVNDTIALYEAGNYIWLRDETSGRNDTAVSGSYVNGQIVGFALDLDSSPQTATFYRNGSVIASNVNIDGLTGKTIFPFTSHYQQTSNANFGGYTNISDAHTNTDENGYGAFVYAPPSGYYAICTKNLAEFG